MNNTLREVKARDIESLDRAEIAQMEQEIYDQMSSNERVMDSYLTRITRLQMLLNLDELRLLQSQEEQEALRELLKSVKD